ncbi:MAG: hypothetical protein ABI441_07030 [Flavobacterium sp.]
MEVLQKEPVAPILELMSKMNYFTKLKNETQNDNSFSIPIKVSSYNELNGMVSSILKTSISLLKNDTCSETETDVLLLLEIALQLLPDDEMELLDELHKLD